MAEKQLIQPDQDIRDNGMYLREVILKIQTWWRYLLSKWLVIIIAGIIGGLFGLLYAYSKKPVYTATTTFVLEENTGSAGVMGQLGGLASLAGIEAGTGSGLFQGDNILEFYKSRSMVEKTLFSEVVVDGRKQLLINRYIEVNRLRESWKTDNVLKTISFIKKPNKNFTRAQDSVIGIIVKNINANYLRINKLDKKSSIIKVETSAQDEFFAKTFNSQIVQNVNDFYVQAKTKKSLENLAILQHQADSVRNVLNGAIYSIVAVEDATPNLNRTRQVLKVPAQRSQFNAEVNKIILSQLVQNLELAKMSLRKETPLIQVIDRPVYPLEKATVGKLKAMVLGCMLFSFLVAMVLISNKIYTQILHEE